MKVKVKNRSASITGYTIPGVCRRKFQPGETQEVPHEEIERLLYQPGGEAIFEGSLQLSKEDRAKFTSVEAEIEYSYNEDKVKQIMLKGSLDEFLDTLDFAPDGVISLIKTYAVSLPLTDMNKIEALKAKTGFDAGKAIQFQKAVDAETDVKTTEVGRQRRVQPSKYDIIK